MLPRGLTPLNNCPFSGNSLRSSHELPSEESWSLWKVGHTQDLARGRAGLAGDALLFDLQDRWSDRVTLSMLAFSAGRARMNKRPRDEEGAS